MAKAVGIKTGGKEKEFITIVLTVRADGGKLMPLVVLKGNPTELDKAPAPNSTKREFLKGKNKKGVSYPLNVIYAVDEKGESLALTARHEWGMDSQGVGVAAWSREFLA